MHSCQTPRFVHLASSLTWDLRQLTPWTAFEAAASLGQLELLGWMNGRPWLHMDGQWSCWKHVARCVWVEVVEGPLVAHQDLAP